MRPVLGAELGTETSCIISSLLHFSSANRSLIPSFLWSSSRRVATRFFPEQPGHPQSHTLRTLPSGRDLAVFGVRRLVGLSFINKRVLQFSDIIVAGSSPSVPAIVTPATVTL